MNINELFELIDKNDSESLKTFIKKHNLIIKNNKLYHKDTSFVQNMIEYWDKRQLVRKIMLNSVYGALTNLGSKFFDQRMGQSCTLTGRCITRHIGNVINELFLGKDHKNQTDKNICLYFDTDSCDKNTMIETNNGKVSVEHLFHMCNEKWINNDKEYGADKSLTVLGYNSKKDVAQQLPFNYVYRHKTSKPKWKIVTESGKEIIITNDHSIMVERDNKLIGVKAAEILSSDMIISVK